MNPSKTANQVFLRASLWPLWLSFSLAVLVMTMLATAACSKGTTASADATPAPATPTVVENPKRPQFASPASPILLLSRKSTPSAPSNTPAKSPPLARATSGAKTTRSSNTTSCPEDDHLKGDEVEDDAFTADTVEGKFPVRNIIAKFPGKKDGIIAILGHYDTNYRLRNTGYVGANDGGSSTAILLEFANQLRGKTRDGYSVWLVWTDGEEAVQPLVRHRQPLRHAPSCRKMGERRDAEKNQSAYGVDMIGDADLDIQRDTNSTPWLLDLIYTAAQRGGYQSHFYALEGPMEDDHLPFAKRGVPQADVIDLDYGYNNVFHHTPQDTMDKLSPKSLEIVGNTILETIRLIDQR